MSRYTSAVDRQWTSLTELGHEIESEAGGGVGRGNGRGAEIARVRRDFVVCTVYRSLVLLPASHSILATFAFDLGYLGNLTA